MKFSVGDKAILNDDWITGALVTIEFVHEEKSPFPYLVCTDYEILDNQGMRSKLEQYPAKESELRPLTKLAKALT